MKANDWKWVYGLVLGAFLCGHAGTALAGAHTWDVSEVFSNADGSIQFIELEEQGGGINETGLPGTNLTSNTQGLTPIGGSAPSPTSNRFFLIATAGFAALPGAPKPDVIIPGGSVPFFSTGGDTISYGPYDSWTFGAVPMNGVNSLNRDSSTGPSTPTNYSGNSWSPTVPALSQWGWVLAAGLLVLVGAAAVLRSRAATA